ncbi:hypothetical protein [Acinetobacter baumannii]|uniref:hypothetical protein n=1 Tax=Acinetobacter baumannii TaxID=470 RepID=UPI0024B73C23|nr:hypothetical protein [Acinetobacter baumannii]
MKTQEAPLVHFLFKIQSTIGEFNYSVIAPKTYKAEDEVSKFFSRDPKFKIIKQSVSNTYTYLGVNEK